VLVCAVWPSATSSRTLGGDSGRDSITGTSRADVLRGRSGSDRLLGRGGADRLYGDRGKDRVYGGNGADVLRGGPHGDRLVGNSGADVLRGGSGDDTIRARGGGRDRIYCGPGRDRATLDSGDVIADATDARPEGRCEIVRRPAAADAHLIAVGDIAQCPSGNAAITAALVDTLPGTIAALGDTVYQSGTLQEYANCFEPLWGRHKARMRPAAGNHEYDTPGASGFYSYFGAAAGEPGKGYYSYDLGAWHVVALNSNCGDVGGCHAGSAQEQWLRADLVSNPAKCTVAYLHHAAFSSGNEHGGSPAIRPLVRALQDHGAELLMSGHEHDYERFAPQTVEGAASPTGVRQFVVGTGGAALRQFKSVPEPNSEVRIAGVYGVLSLRLREDEYQWRFVPQPGSSATDSGESACH
jgi:hypothetical protein